jgi:hypothetical protein
MLREDDVQEFLTQRKINLFLGGGSSCCGDIRHSDESSEGELRIKEEEIENYEDRMFAVVMLYL